MLARTHARMHACTRMHPHASMHALMRARVQACARTHTRMYARTQARTQARRHARMQAPTHARMPACRRAGTQACTRAQAHTRAHAALYARAWRGSARVLGPRAVVSSGVAVARRGLMLFPARCVHLRASAGPELRAIACWRVPHTCCVGRALGMCVVYVSVWRCTLSARLRTRAVLM